MASTAETEVSNLSFEAALARLEEIVRTLEKGEAPLDRSIELYQEGDRLKRHCEARLKNAQARIEQIAFGSDGKPAGGKPFDADLDHRSAWKGAGGRGGPRFRRGRRFLRPPASAYGRQPRAPLRSHAPCRDRRRQAAAAIAQDCRLTAVRDRRRASASRRMRDRGYPRLLADPRRPAVHG